jgi:hypothetical protein
MSSPRVSLDIRGILNSSSGVSAVGGYRVYRGVAADLPKLLDASDDSCVRFEGTGTATGPVVAEIPAAGSFYWYLAIGVRGPLSAPMLGMLDTPGARP